MNIQKNIPLAGFSTFSVGGTADFFAEIRDKNDLLSAVDFAKSRHLKPFFLGGGSNILFSDRGFRGIIFHFQNQKILFKNDEIVAESGAKNAEIFTFAKKVSRDFSAFLNVPGTIGGAVFGNAGTPAAEIGDFVAAAELFDFSKNNFFIAEKDFFRFEYRKSFLKKNPNLILWKIFLKLPEKNPAEIEKSAKNFVKKRHETQPIGKTGGSFFKNPEKGAAGFFLEKAGFRGRKIGGAFFSEKHANFLMNDGTATQKDLLDLARAAKKAVFEKFGVSLENEIRIFDEWGGEIRV